MKRKRAGQSSRPVTINVGGTMFTISHSTIMQYPDTMLGTMLSERWNSDDGDKDDDKEPIFLDRDPVRFRYILDFYRNGKIVLPHTITKAEIIAEVDYFALPVEKEDIHYDIDSIAEIKKGFEDFEQMFVVKLKKTAYENARVACAHEMAALLLEKIRKSLPGTTSIDFSQSDVPRNSFVHPFYERVTFDPTFTTCIEGLVQQAGYSYYSNMYGRISLQRNQDV